MYPSEHIRTLNANDRLLFVNCKHLNPVPSSPVPFSPPPKTPIPSCSAQSNSRLQVVIISLYYAQFLDYITYNNVQHLTESTTTHMLVI